MAHFAEIGDDGMVLRVVVIADEDCLDEDGNHSEAVGKDFCAEVVSSTNEWVQTSYNTRNGKHRNGGTPLRHNFASITKKYDSELDAFYEPNPPYASWTFDESSLEYVAPIARPSEGNYEWDVEVGDWAEVSE